MNGIEPLSKDEIDALVSKGMLSPDVANQLAPPTAEIPPIVQPMNSALVPGAPSHVAPVPGPAMPPPNGGDASAMAAVAAKMGMPGAPAPIVPPPAPPPVKPPVAPIVQPAAFKPPTPFAQPKPMPTGGGPSPTAVSALSKVYTPAQIAGFGLKAEEIAQAGEHNAALAEMQASKAGDDAETVSAALDVANQKLAKMEAAEAERRQVKQAAITSLNGKWDELAHTEIDPDRYWNSKDTGEKVLAMIGLILGGIGGGLQGTGRNAAMDVLQSNINRDVEAQKATFMAKSQALQGKQSVFRDMMSEFGDERMAEQATYATHWDMVSKQLQSIALTSQNDVAKQNALYAKQYADNQVAQYVEGVQANAELTLKQMQAAAAAAAHAKMAARDEAIWKANLSAAQAKATELGGEVVPDATTGMVYVQKGILPDGRPNIVWEGTKGGGESGTASVVTGFNAAGQPTYEKIAAPKAEAAKMTASNEAYADAKAALAELKQIHKDTGIVYNTPGEVSAREAAIARLKLAAMKTITGGGGRVSPMVAEQINQMIPTSDEVADWAASGKATEKLNQLDKMLDSQHANMLKGGGAGGETLPLEDIEGGTPSEE